VPGLVGLGHFLEHGAPPAEPAPVARHDAFDNCVYLFRRGAARGQGRSERELGASGPSSDTSGPPGSSSAPLSLYFMSRRTTVTSGMFLTLVASVVVIFH